MIASASAFVMSAQASRAGVLAASALLATLRSAGGFASLPELQAIATSATRARRGMECVRVSSVVWAGSGAGVEAVRRKPRLVREAAPAIRP